MEELGYLSNDLANDSYRFEDLLSMAVLSGGCLGHLGLRCLGGIAASGSN